MKIIDVSSGNNLPIQILPVDSGDFKSLTKKRYFFDWKEEKDFEIYKLQILNSKDILGLVSIERIPNEWRIHIRLITVSFENKGAKKQYENIAGSLIAHVAKMAVEEFGELACVSLTPKNTIAQHYIDRYKMVVTGKTLSLEVPEILNLINTYCYEDD